MPIYTDKVTYGQSNTPSENHFIDGSTPNVLSIKRGTPLAPGAEVLKVNAGVVSFPATQGSILQVQTFTDAGTSTSSVSYVNLVASTKSFTPRSTNSTIIVSISGQFGCANYTGFNSVGNFQIYRDSLVPLGTIYSVSAVTVAGGNGANCAGNITALYTNTTLAVKSFGIGGYNSVSTVQCWAQNLVITITEVQN